MRLLSHMLREFQDDFDAGEYHDAEPDDAHTHTSPAQQEDTRKTHKIKQTFSVDQGDTKLDTTVMIRVVASNEQDAHRIADQQLSKLAAYMKDVDLNDREDHSEEERDFGGIRERANKLWQNRR